MLKSTRRTRRAKSGSKMVKGAGITTIGGTAMYTSAASIGFVKINLHPLTISTRTADVANSFSSYRFTKLKFSALPSGVQLSILAYTDKPESVTATSVSTATQFAELPCAVINPASCTNVRSMKVPAAFLRGNFEWYNCNTGADITGTNAGGVAAGTYNVIELTIQGQILLWQGTANSNNYWIEYECQFRDPSFGDSSPAPLLASRMLSGMTEEVLLDELARRRKPRKGSEELRTPPPLDFERSVTSRWSEGETGPKIL